MRVNNTKASKKKLKVRFFNYIKKGYYANSYIKTLKTSIKLNNFYAIN